MICVLSDAREAKNRQDCDSITEYLFAQMVEAFDIEEGHIPTSFLLLRRRQAKTFVSLFYISLFKDEVNGS
jgi:hypothetical protein